MALEKYPGFIDVHVHLRDPGATHKEDLRTGTQAAVRGGFTFVIDMPNNPQPTITITELKNKRALAQKKAVCDVGFHFGTNGKNTSFFAAAARNSRVFGLKLYCNHTTGEMLIEDVALLEEVFKKWNSTKPILVHAEGVQLAAAISLAQLYGRRLHVCHISQAIEVELVRRAKQKKWQVSAGVCPHHLFFTGSARDTLGSRALMKPPLGTQQDQDALWEGLLDRTIDVVETDHAPHTLQEKASEKPPFGVPGLETAVGLLFLAVKQKKIPKRLIKTVLYTQPRKLFAIPEQKNTFVMLDPDQSWRVEPPYASKCGWSLFEGWQLYGRIESVTYKGKKVMEQGKLV